jgi:hypothetical protein
MNRSVSEIDDPNFFLSKDGKTNPESELIETIKSLYNESQFDDNSTACRYPARKLWLQKKLDLQLLPEVNCMKFDALMKKLDPHSTTLVFPNAHINSPASMFGHTFLRIDSKYQSKLLSYAVNYSADANQDTENSAIYAYKGIFGGYPGLYSLLAYTDKLKEYRDTDRRDIWEYELNLTKEETILMMNHIWELNSVYSWYYFFSENCSYNMLWLLEIARPSISLRDNFTYFVTPPATIQAIYEENFISKQNFRPSKRTTLLAYEDALGSQKIIFCDAVAKSERKIEEIIDNENILLQEKQYMLESIALLLEYYYLNNKIGKEVYVKKLHKTLTLRAQLGKGKKLEVKKGANPDETHKTTRLKVEGIYRNSEYLGLLGVRPSYHTLDDIGLGFLEGTQIEFFDAQFTYMQKSSGKNSLAVEKLTLISIASYTKLSALFRPMAYGMSGGWNQDSLINRAQFSTDVNFGVSFGTRHTYIYTLMENSVYVGGEFVSNITAAVGAKVGLVSSHGKYFQTNIDAKWRYYDSLEDQKVLHVSEHLRLEKNHTLSFGFDYVEKSNEDQKSMKVSYDYFF